jgi:hypothetical protein
MVIINNVDASTNSGDTTSVSNSNASAGSSALSAMDLMYFRRGMKDNMLHNPQK